jgi:hypothetical protein
MTLGFADKKRGVQATLVMASTGAAQQSASETVHAATQALEV